MTNDEKIVELQAEIAKKKAQLDVKFEYKTNMKIELNGNKCDVSVLQRKELFHMAILLSGYIMSAKELGLLDELVFSEYNAQLWLEDILHRIEYLKTKEELAKLVAAETKLSSLLSQEKKAELEIEKIRLNLT